MLNHTCIWEHRWNLLWLFQCHYLHALGIELLPWWQSCLSERCHQLLLLLLFSLHSMILERHTRHGLRCGHPLQEHKMEIRVIVVVLFLEQLDELRMLFNHTRITLWENSLGQGDSFILLAVSVHAIRERSEKRKRNREKQQEDFIVKKQFPPPSTQDIILDCTDFAKINLSTKLHSLDKLDKESNQFFSTWAERRNCWKKQLCAPTTSNGCWEVSGVIFWSRNLCHLGCVEINATCLDFHQQQCAALFPHQQAAIFDHSPCDISTSSTLQILQTKSGCCPTLHDEETPAVSIPSCSCCVDNSHQQSAFQAAAAALMTWMSEQVEPSSGAPASGGCCSVETPQKCHEKPILWNMNESSRKWLSGILDGCRHQNQAMEKAHDWWVWKQCWHLSPHRGSFVHSVSLVCWFFVSKEKPWLPFWLHGQTNAQRQDAQSKFHPLNRCVLCKQNVHANDWSWITSVHKCIRQVWTHSKMSNLQKRQRCWKTSLDATNMRMAKQPCNLLTINQNGQPFHGTNPTKVAHVTTVEEQNWPGHLEWQKMPHWKILVPHQAGQGNILGWGGRETTSQKVQGQEACCEGHAPLCSVARPCCNGHNNKKMYNGLLEIWPFVEKRREINNSKNWPKWNVEMEEVIDCHWTCAREMVSSKSNWLTDLTVWHFTRQATKISNGNWKVRAAFEIHQLVNASPGSLSRQVNRCVWRHAEILVQNTWPPTGTSTHCWTLDGRLEPLSRLCSAAFWHEQRFEWSRSAVFPPILWMSPPPKMEDEKSCAVNFQAKSQTIDPGWHWGWGCRLIRRRPRRGWCIFCVCANWLSLNREMLCLHSCCTFWCNSFEWHTQTGKNVLKAGTDSQRTQGTFCDPQTWWCRRSFNATLTQSCHSSIFLSNVRQSCVKVASNLRQTCVSILRDVLSHWSNCDATLTQCWHNFDAIVSQFCLFVKSVSWLLCNCDMVAWRNSSWLVCIECVPPNPKNTNKKKRLNPAHDTNCFRTCDTNANSASPGSVRKFAFRSKFSIFCCARRLKKTSYIFSCCAHKKTLCKEERKKPNDSSMCFGKLCGWACVFRFSFKVAFRSFLGRF